MVGLKIGEFFCTKKFNGQSQTKARGKKRLKKGKK